MSEVIAVSLDPQAAAVTHNGRVVRLVAVGRYTLHSCSGCFGESRGCIPGTAPCGSHSRKDKRYVIWKEAPHA